MRSPSDLARTCRRAPRIGGAALGFVVLGIGAGCSGGSGTSSAPSTGSTTSVTSHASSPTSTATPSAGAAATSAGASSTSGVSAYTPSGSGSPSLVLAERPYSPQAGRTSGTLADLAGQESAVATRGVLFRVPGGAAVRPSTLTKDVAVVWMSKDYVLAKETLAACSSSCTASKAPAGATQVLVIAPEKVADIGVDTKIDS